MDEPHDDEPRTYSTPRRVAVIAAAINLGVWCVVLLVFVFGVVTTPVGPAGDADATDGVFSATLGCAPVFVIALVSAFLLPIAGGWRGRRLARLTMTVVGVSLALLLILAVMLGP